MRPLAGFGVDLDQLKSVILTSNHTVMAHRAHDDVNEVNPLKPYAAALAASPPANTVLMSSIRQETASWHPRRTLTAR